MRTLSVVIPVYNEDQSVLEVVRRVLKVRLPGIRKEIIVVNDGSTDRTREKVMNFARQTKGIRVYNSEINLGKGAAVRIGLAKSRGEVVIIQDADLELDPCEYDRLVNPIFEGRAEVVYGSRFRMGVNRTISLRTRLANRGLTMITNLLFGSRLTDMETAYKAFRSDVLTGVRLRALEFEIEPEITARICQKGIKILEVPISYNPRTTKEGKKIRFKDGVEAVWVLFRCKFL